MAIIDLADAKAHLALTTDDDDALVTDKIESAQATIEQLLGYAIEDRFTAVPADLKEAVRQLAAHFYENREASVIGLSVGLLPLGVSNIVRSRRDWIPADVE